MENKDLYQRVHRQEIEIKYIKKAIEEIAENTKKQGEHLLKISETISKQEVILEKLTNLEERQEGDIKRCHKRIDMELERWEKEVKNKPCVSVSALEKDIELLKHKTEKHDKIFWWLGTMVIGAIVLSLIRHELIK